MKKKEVRGRGGGGALSASKHVYYGNPICQLPAWKQEQAYTLRYGCLIRGLAVQGSRESPKFQIYCRESGLHI